MPTESPNSSPNSSLVPTLRHAAPTERSAFEQYAAQMGLRDFEMSEFGRYRNPFTQQYRDFWVAALDYRRAALDKLEPVSKDHSELERLRALNAELAQALRAIRDNARGRGLPTIEMTADAALAKLEQQ